MSSHKSLPLNIIIVDDESLARLRLSQLCEDIQTDCPNKVIAQYPNASALINELPNLQLQFNLQLVPSVILLDINMPSLNGIDVADFLKKNAPYINIVFITAEAQHAVAAFELSVVDYVLKPVRAARLLVALQKVLQIAYQFNHSNELNNELKKLKELKSIEPHITVHLDDGTVTAIPASVIVYFKAENKMTIVHTNKHTYTCNLNLNELEQSLNVNKQLFIRVHRNALINLSACGVLYEKDRCAIQVLGLKNEAFLQVSRRMLPSLREVLLK
jgi:two-component system, LytTR family, response regulator AlgR